MVEHLLAKEGVASSNLVFRSIFLPPIRAESEYPANGGNLTRGTCGVADRLDNLQLLCSSSNRIKGDRSQEYLVARLGEIGG